MELTVRENLWPLQIFMYVYTYMHVTCVCVSVYIHIHARTSIYMYTRTHIFPYLLIFSFLSLCENAFDSTDRWSLCVYVCVCAWSSVVFASARTYVCVLSYARLNVGLNISIKFLYLWGKRGNNEQCQSGILALFKVTITAFINVFWYIKFSIF